MNIKVKFISSYRLRIIFIDFLKKPHYSKGTATDRFTHNLQENVQSEYR